MSDEIEQHEWSDADISFSRKNANHSIALENLIELGDGASIKSYIYLTIDDAVALAKHFNLTLEDITQ